MKILLLHLSDIHIKDSGFCEDKYIKSIVSTLTEVPKFEQVILLFSGDVAFSGKSEQYEHAKHFLGKIIKNIKDKYLDDAKRIHTIIVPGNHDIDFNGQNRNRSEIASVWKENSLQSYIDSDINKMSKFFEFANYNGCFKSKSLVDNIILEYGHYSIQFNLINSASLSILNDINGDNEQGLHYLPPMDFEKLHKLGTANVCFTIMHHSLDWFSNTIREQFSDAIVSHSTALFVGHNHIQHSEFKNVDGNSDCMIVRGGTIQSLGQASEFNCVILDTETNFLNVYGCRSIDGDVYEVSLQQERSIEKLYRYRDFQINKEFFYEINSANFNGMSTNELFVFPSMLHILDEYNNTDKIESFDDFVSTIDKCDVCYIEGGDLSGKTQLLRYLYLKSFEKAVPLLIDAADIKGESINEIVKANFFKQYTSESKIYSKYLQLDKSLKVIFIDNLDKIKHISKFIAEVQAKCGKVICTSRLSLNVDIKEALLAQITEDHEICRLQIEPFYYKKRKELISKACKTLYQRLSDSALSTKTREINDFIMGELKIFNISPYFILSYCNNFSKRTISDRSNLNTFSEVFKANMVKSLESVTSYKVETILFILEEIAYQTVISKVYPMSISFITDIVDRYNKLYDQKINVIEFINNLVDAKILKYYGNQYLKFSSESILAFFAGKKISDNRHTEEGRTIIKALIKNICFGINADIIQFIIAFNNDSRLLNMLICEANSFFDELEEFSFEKNNLPYLNSPVPQLHLPAPDQTKKLAETKRIEQHERHVKTQIETINIFDYTEDDLNKFVNKQARLQRLSILTSMLYSNFYHIILATDKGQYVDSIFSQPNKIVFYMLEPFSKNFSTVIDELYEEIHDNNPNLTKENIAEIFVSISQTMILNVYDFVARNCGTDETIDSLKKFADNSKNVNYKIILTMILENMNKLEQFGKLAEKIDDDSNSKCISAIIKRIVYKHFIWNNVPIVKYGQHLADRYFENNRTQLDKIRKKSFHKKR